MRFGSLVAARLNSKHLLDRGKFLRRFVEGLNAAIADVIDPGVQPDGPASQPACHCRVCPQMLELQEDVFLYEGTGHVIAGSVWILGPDDP